MTDRRVALVTGSSRGIGRAILSRLADDHACVVHFRRDREAADVVAESLRARGVPVLVHGADLRHPEEVAGLLGAVEDRFGRLDTVVASAAATKFGPVLEVEPRHLEATFATVVGSYVQLARGLAALTTPDADHGHGPRLVAIGGLDARFAQAGHGLLGAAKAALEALTRSLAVELAPLGGTANVVVPGAIATDSLDLYFRDGGGPSPARQAMEAGVPAGRLGTVDDVAELVAFLASAAAGYLTGQAVVVDGGAQAEGGAWSQFRTLWSG